VCVECQQADGADFPLATLFDGLGEVVADERGIAAIDRNPPQLRRSGVGLGSIDRPGLLAVRSEVAVVWPGDGREDRFDRRIQWEYSVGASAPRAADVVSLLGCTPLPGPSDSESGETPSLRSTVTVASGAIGRPSRRGSHHGVVVAWYPQGIDRSAGGSQADIGHGGPLGLWASRPRIGLQSILFHESPPVFIVAWAAQTGRSTVGR